MISCLSFFVSSRVQILILLSYLFVIQWSTTYAEENDYSDIEETVESEEQEHMLYAKSPTENSIEVKCLGQNKIIKANFITTQTLTKGKYLENNYCTDPLHYDEPKSIAVFALNTIQVDEDIVSPGNRIIFIAPKWEIIANREINLNGLGAKNVDKCKIPGENGNTGLPGEPGGVFFGIGLEFINGQNLKITAHGGKGSDGKDGCPGRDGENGVDAHRYREMCDDKPLDVYLNATGIPANNGHNGGDGGAAGLGGKPGSIVLIEFDKKSNISTITSHGPDGVEGKGAKGGLAGKGNIDIQYKCERDTVRSGVKIAHYFSYIVPYDIKYYIDPVYNGLHGGNGMNSYKMKKPLDFKPISNLSSIINEFKSFVLENLLSHIESADTLVKFLRHIDHDEKVHLSYDLLGFFDELIRMENHFYKLSIGNGFVPFYKSFFIRVSKFLKKFDNESKDMETDLKDQYENAIYYLLNKVKIDRIEVVEHDSRVYNKMKWDLFKSTLHPKTELFKSYKRDLGRIRLINTIQNGFKSRIKNYIQEVEKLIDEKINPKMEEINKRIEKKIDDLVTNVTEAIRTKTNDIAKQSKNLDEIEKSTQWHLLFDFIGFMCKAASFLGPEAAVVGGIAGAISSTVDKSLFPEPNSSVSQSFDISAELVSELRKQGVSVKTIMKEKYETLQKLIEKTEKHVENHPDIQDQLKTLKDRIKTVSEQDSSILSYHSIKKDLNRSLRLIEIRLESSADLHETAQKLPFFKLSGDFDSFFQANEALINMFKKRAGSQIKVKKTYETIKMYNNQLHNLKLYKNIIDVRLLNLMKKVRDDWIEAHNELGQAESKIKNSMLEWKVSEVLGAVKKKIIELTKDFKDIKDDFVESFNDLEGVLDKLTKAYDEIMESKKEEKFVDFLSSLATVSVLERNHEISGLLLIQPMYELDLLAQSNSLLQQYSESINSIKKFVFPFAFHYLEERLNSKSRVSLIKKASETAQLLESLQSKLAENNWIPKYIKYDEYEPKDGWFGGEQINSFSLWNAEDHQKDITRFLSGEKVIFTADLNNFETKNFHAIKFKNIQLFLATNDTDDQINLSKYLNSFQIKMKHFGDSYYRWGDNIYSIPTKPYSITYAFSDDPDLPTILNSEIDIEGGDFLLSPYGTWEMSLSHVPKKNNITLDHLLQYKNKINLELRGHASYIENVVEDTSNFKMDKYYKVMINDADVSIKKALSEKIYNVYEEDLKMWPAYANERRK